MQRNSKPVVWRPKGCSDTLESSETFNGAMAALINLVPDPTTNGLYQCRPAATSVSDLNGSGFSTGFDSGFGGPFLTPGFISIAKVFGSYVYGLVATQLNPGYDQPFVFNLATNSFVTVTGVTGTNVPASPSTTGAWTPPTMDVIGSKVVVTHPGFSGAFGVFFGYFDISSLSAPVWNGGNCSGANFPSFTVPPIAVAQYANRAFFIHNLMSFPAVIFSDILNPLSNSTGAVVPILTFGDSVPLIALGGLPLNTTTGGIIQSLMVFKGSSNIFQITGDAATNDLAVNSLNVPTGTLAPATVVSTPLGLAFVSPDGLRIIDFSARVGPIIGHDGQGISVPFIYSNVPSRMCAAANGAVIRITTQNAFIPGSPFQEWWYDFNRQKWNGPHTCAMSCISPYQGTFIGVLNGVNANLFRSDYEQSNTSTFTENQAALTYTYTTSLLPDTDQMTNNVTTMSTLDLALSSATSNVTVTAVNQNGTVIDTVTVTSPGGAPLWDTAIWDQFVWDGTQSALAPRQLEWTKNIDFVRLQISATGTSTVGLKIGALHLRYKTLRFLVDIGAVA